jgi:hypothetical protein
VRLTGPFGRARSSPEPSEVADPNVALAGEAGPARLVAQQDGPVRRAIHPGVDDGPRAGLAPGEHFAKPDEPAVSVDARGVTEAAGPAQRPGERGGGSPQAGAPLQLRLPVPSALLIHLAQDRALPSHDAAPGAESSEPSPASPCRLAAAERVQ